MANKSVRALAAAAVSVGLLCISAPIAGAQAPPQNANGRRLGPSVRKPRTGRFLLNTLDGRSPGAHDGLSPTQSKAIVDRYCAACHNERVRAGELVLSTLDFSTVPAHAEPLERVVRTLSSGAMPPVGAPHPDRATSEALIAALQISLDREAAARPDPGPAPLRRLNRTEYANAIRDLLDLNIDVSSLLPVDHSSGGFESVADVVEVSPALMEPYLAAARRVSAIAVGGAAAATAAGEESASGDTLSRRLQMCTTGPTLDETGCATKMLSAIARRAFRRPVTEVEVRMLVGFFETGRQNGSFESAIELALTRILASPDFVFRFERDPAALPTGAVHRVRDIELASRLSFFLWSTIPDEPLLRLAAQKQLRNPIVLDRQIRRMLADPRARALEDQFAAQSFYLRSLRHLPPDALLESSSSSDGSRPRVSGAVVDGAVSAHEGLASDPKIVVATMTEKLMTYALGRGLVAHDMPAVRRVVRTASQSDYRFSSIVSGIVKSVPFQLRVKTADELD